MNCTARYGPEYWCGTLSDWRGQCNSTGDLKNPNNSRCDPSTPDSYYCMKCGTGNNNCHTHTNPGWVTDGGYKIKVVQLGCTKEGCEEGNTSATEALIEIKHNGTHCGEQFWVWIDTKMSPNNPDIGTCYNAEIFTTMYGPNCGHVVRYLMSRIEDCPTCPNHPGINCTATYGHGYWCGTYYEWTQQCNSTGYKKYLGNTTTCDLSKTDSFYCIKC